MATKTEEMPHNANGHCDTLLTQGERPQTKTKTKKEKEKGEIYGMKNDKVKKWLCLILIFGGFFILRNFVPSGLDQAGWDGFLVLFVAVLLWLTEAVPMAVTAVFVLFFGA